jgi:hypothetical protein
MLLIKESDIKDFKFVSRTSRDILPNPAAEIALTETLKKRKTKNEIVIPFELLNFRQALVTKQPETRINLQIREPIPAIESWENRESCPGDGSGVPANLQRLFENNLEKWIGMSPKDSETLAKLWKMKENGMRLDNYKRFLKFLVFAEAFQEEIEMKKFDMSSVKITPTFEDRIQLFQVTILH